MSEILEILLQFQNQNKARFLQKNNLVSIEMDWETIDVHF